MQSAFSWRPRGCWLVACAYACYAFAILRTSSAQQSPVQPPLESPLGNIPPALRQRQVETGDQLRRAASDGVRHIVVTQHLQIEADASSSVYSPVLSLGGSAATTGVGGTQTIRGNCSAENPSPPSEALSQAQRLTVPTVGRLTPTQCMLTFVTGPPLIFAAMAGNVWLSDLYIYWPLPVSVDADPTMLQISNGTALLSNVILHGNPGWDSRAVDVGAGGRVCVINAIVRGFKMFRGAAIRLQPGAIGTFSRITFDSNFAEIEAAGSSAAGPIAYVAYDAATRTCAAAWFHDCVFGESSSDFDTDVAIDSDDCRVYTNTRAAETGIMEPLVWNFGSAKETNPWFLTRKRGAVGANLGGDLDAERSPSDDDNGALGGIDFARPSDEWVSEVAAEQAQETGLRLLQPEQLPSESVLVAEDPRDASEGFWTDRNIGIVVGVGSAGLMVLVAALVWYAGCRGDAANVQVEQEVSKYVPTGFDKVVSLDVQSHQASGEQPLANPSTPWASSSKSRSACMLQSNAPLPTTTVTLQVPYRPAPQADSSDKERLEYLDYQLDTLRGQEVLGGLVFQEGSGSRAHGGQAVVQFAANKYNRQQSAVKFFLSRPAFDSEAAQYVDSDSPLRQFLPQVRDIIDNEDGRQRDGNGEMLPPCIVMEKGESLDRWVRRNNRAMDQFTCMQIIHHICECLMDLHGAGYAHRDLKPGNIMWLPSQNRWTLIDFGCASRIGEEARTGFTLAYAAPEAVKAYYRDEKKYITSTPSLDAWSLGVLCVELFTGLPALALFDGREKVISQLVGEDSLPWEGDQNRRDLLRRAGRFKEAILGLLERDPARRCLIETFMRQCSSIVSSTTQQQERDSLSAESSPMRISSASGKQLAEGGT